MSNSEDVLDRLDRMMNGEESDSRSDLEYMCESLAAEVRELRRGLSDAQRMIVLLMNQREWGAATGALLEDPVVRRAYAAMAQENTDDRR